MKTLAATPPEAPMPVKIRVRVIKAKGDRAEGRQREAADVEAIVVKVEPPDVCVSPCVSPRVSPCPPQDAPSTHFRPATTHPKRKHDDGMNDCDGYAEKEKRRESLLEQFLQELDGKEIQQRHFKERKERRDEAALKNLQQMVAKLKTISKTQEEILRNQESVLGNINESRNKKS